MPDECTIGARCSIICTMSAFCASDLLSERRAMQETYDVVVLGSGAAGLTAALAAAVAGGTVAVFEKSDHLGGTTAFSGGGIWIPGNQLAREAGLEDSTECGLEYLTSLSNGMILPELAEALVNGGPLFIDFLHEHTDIRLVLVPGY